MIEGQRFSAKKDQAAASCVTLPASFRGGSRPFQQSSSRRLRGPVPMHFETFYRAHLRFAPGSRLKSSDVARFYSAWATANDAPSLTLRQIKRTMSSIGHRSMNSNGIQYCDVGLAAENTDLPDNYPAMPLPAEAQAAAIAERLEAMITELSSIRAEVVGAPHAS